MITITWSDSATPEATPDRFVVSDEVLASLEKYRMSLTAPQQTMDGSYATLPKYADVKSMVVGIFIDVLARPAMSMFPPATLASAIEQAKAAQAAAEAAKAEALQGILAAPQA